MKDKSKHIVTDWNLVTDGKLPNRCTWNGQPPPGKSLGIKGYRIKESDHKGLTFETQAWPFDMVLLDEKRLLCN